MTVVRITSKNGLVELVFETSENEATVITMGQDLAIQIGAAMIGRTDTQISGSLLEYVQMTSIRDPAFEVKRTDSSPGIAAFLPNKMRPIFIQPDPKNASGFQATILDV